MRKRQRLLFAFIPLLMCAFIILPPLINKPEIKDFRLLDLGWPAYCDFYKSEAAQSEGQAVFAMRSNPQGRLYVIQIDGELREFDHIVETRKDRIRNWLMFNEIYNVRLEITNTSDVSEVQVYTGTMTVRRGRASETIPILGRCSA